MFHLKIKSRGRFLSSVKNKFLSNRHGFLRKEDGQVIIEFALIMPLLAIMLLATVIIYDFNAKRVVVLEELRHDMRLSMNNHWLGDFSSRTKTESARVDIHGFMAKFLRMPYIEQQLEIFYYEGTYPGINYKNAYRNRGKSQREIKL